MARYGTKLQTVSSFMAAGLHDTTTVVRPANAVGITWSTDLQGFEKLPVDALFRMLVELVASAVEFEELAPRRVCQSQRYIRNSKNTKAQRFVSGAQKTAAGSEQALQHEMEFEAMRYKHKGKGVRSNASCHHRNTHRTGESMIPHGSIKHMLRCL